MAQIVLSGDELVGILQANGLIPDQVTDIEVDGEEIKLKVKTPWPLLKSLRVGVRFEGFNDDHVALQLVTNRLIDTFDWLVDKMLDSFPLADYGGRWEYPCLYVDVNKLLQERIRGVKIDDVEFFDGQFRITTVHPPIAEFSDDAEADIGEDTSCTPSL
ncbi:MAG: hypothetical protein JSW27_19135 [Phycisphaerales bacterium]|nr:MAG: hypothetical protein JSW27_19135 [Phycisphaerales bacterium]